MDPVLSNQSGLNIAFNPTSSGSIAATTSSGYTAANSEDTDPEITFQSSLVPQSYGGMSMSKGHSFQNQQFSSSTNRLWNARSTTSGLASSPSITSSINSPNKVDTQGTHLPSFMNNSLFDSCPSKQPYTVQNVKSHFANLQTNGVYNMPKHASKEPLAEPSQFVNYNHGHPFHISSTLQRKKTNTSEYNSAMASVTSLDDKPAASETRSNIQSTADQNTKPYIFGAKSFDTGETETIEMLKSELSFKNQINESLKDKLQSLSVNEDTVDGAVSSTGESIKLPRTYQKLFKDLYSLLKEKNKQLEEAKSKLEAIIVGLVMTKDDSIVYSQEFDAQDIAHRITNKLSVLQKENEALLSMISYSNKQSLLIELGLLKTENRALCDRLKELDAKTQTPHDQP